MWNDPINWVDPSGEFAQIAIGFVSGFVTDVLWQVVIDGHDLSCINYKRALIAGAADAAGIGLLKLFSKARRLYKFTKAAEEVAELAPKSAGALIKSDGLSFGLKLGRHAQLERMVEKGVTKPMIDAALRKGQTFWDPARKTLQFVLNPTSGKMVGVSVNPATKTITTVMRQSRRLVRPRYQQISREAVEQMLK